MPSENGGTHSAVHLLNPAYTDYDNNFATDFDNGTYLPADFEWVLRGPRLHLHLCRRSSAWKTATASFAMAVGARHA